VSIDANEGLSRSLLNADSDTAPRESNLARWSSSSPGSIVKVLVGCTLATLFCVFVLSSYWQYEMIFAALACVGAVGLNLLMGYAGQVSVGNAGFMAVGAFSGVWGGEHGGFLMALLVGTVTSALVGGLVGLVCMRLRGFYVVLGTLALTYIAAFVFQEIESGAKVPGGFTLPLVTIGPWNVGFSNKNWLILSIAMLALALIVAKFLVDGRVGRSWMAVRESEAAASVIGINVRFYKLLAFMVSSAIIGLGGVGLAYFVGNVDFNTYTLALAVSYAAMILIGGMGSFMGPLLGAVLVTIVPVELNQLSTVSFFGSFVTNNAAALELFSYGALVIIIMLVEPGGLSVIARRLGSFVFRLVRHPRALDTSEVSA
jgi:branched-chain amino acid transport system permease protein